MEQTGHFFTTIYGRNLIAELPIFVHRPYLVVTMEDLWPKFSHYFDEGLAHVHLVHTLEHEEVDRIIDTLPSCNAVIGLGGGQAIDVANSWLGLGACPCFKYPRPRHRMRPSDSGPPCA
jgi:glycerol-1-phosphate dehydrogenase [NAD(P)+]